MLTAASSSSRKNQGKEKVVVHSRMSPCHHSSSNKQQTKPSSHNISCARRTGQHIRVRATKHLTTHNAGGDSAAKDSAVDPCVNSQGVHSIIQNLRDLGFGEDMTYDEYLCCLKHLPDAPPRVDTSRKLRLGSAQLCNIFECHALYRIKAYKLSQGVSKSDMEDDKWKEDYPPSVLKEMGYFLSFEKDGTLDWSFHTDHCYLAQLDDYQRLVPHNYFNKHGDIVYEKWDEYRQFFHSYEIEQEYVDYCAELSEKLKWIEDYVTIERPLWGAISTRAAYQALKIASGFSRISGDLAYTGYYELVSSMTFDICWYKELDSVHFEIWKRVANQKKCFRDALDEVCKLDKFPLRQDRMRYALDNDCSAIENEFYVCTAGITDEVPEDKAKEMIAVAVKELREKPKWYEQYVKRKIQIARDIGLIPVPKVSAPRVDETTILVLFSQWTILLI
uniref:Uncharacterized protein n=1 Tax=Leersia perrieri TaxID=77586 RepID=A0A0D9VAS2_9ORYZ